MKIAAIAGRYERTLVQASFGTDDVSWTWVDSADELVRVRDADMYLDLGFVMDADRIDQLSQLLPATVIVDSVVNTIAEMGQSFVRVNAWPGFLEQGLHELAAEGEERLAAVKGLYERLGRPYRLVADIPGMVTARIVASIVNEAYYTLQSDVSTADEIDTAMKLGTNYPKGPFEWGRMIGETRIYQLLLVMSEGDRRYMPAEALKAVADDRNRIKM